MLSRVKFLQCLWFGLNLCFMTRGIPRIINHFEEIFVFDDSHINSTPERYVSPLDRNVAKNLSSKQGLSRSVSRAANDLKNYCFAPKLRWLSAVIKIISKTFRVALRRQQECIESEHFRVIKSSSRLDGGFYNVWSLSPYQEREKLARRQSLPYLLNQHQSSEKKTAWWEMCDKWLLIYVRKWW